MLAALFFLGGICPKFVARAHILSRFEQRHAAGGLKYHPSGHTEGEENRCEWQEPLKVAFSSGDGASLGVQTHTDSHKVFGCLGNTLLGGSSQDF